MRSSTSFSVTTVTDWGMSRKAWAEAFSAGYERFCRQVDAHQETALDPYGAESPGEFFAVATEAFFERGQDLRQTQPAVYAELAGFYHVDPATW